MFSELWGDKMKGFNIVNILGIQMCPMVINLLFSFVVSLVQNWRGNLFFFFKEVSLVLIFFFLSCYIFARNIYLII